jgi:hypothetical protein
MENMMAPKTYEDGLLEGEIKMLQQITKTHAERLDSHTQRLTILERIIWMVSGVMIFLQTFPLLRQLVEMAGQK